MARRRASTGVTDFLSDIVDDIKDFLDDDILDRGRDTERDLRRAGRNLTDSDDDGRRTRSRNDSRNGGRSRDAEIDNLRQTLRVLASKIDALAGSSASSDSDLPIAGYDDLTAAEINNRLGALSQNDLERVHAYERANADRTTVTGRIESLRGEQPWDGFDEQTVVEIRKSLNGVEKATAGAVKAYEASHKNRQGVLDAADAAQNT